MDSRNVAFVDKIHFSKITNIVITSSKISKKKLPKIIKDDEGSFKFNCVYLISIFFLNIIFKILT